jgi:hypothetical protein
MVQLRRWRVLAAALLVFAGLLGAAPTAASGASPAADFTKSKECQ